ncbi:hypothetical protein [Archangium violaceum]|nr:hypothetical protein [Archangium violaceum]
MAATPIPGVETRSDAGASRGLSLFTRLFLLILARALPPLVGLG